MEIIKKMKEVVKNNKKRIILPEASDDRVLEAAEYILDNDLCDIILIGAEEEIKKSGKRLAKAQIFDPGKNKELADTLINDFVILRKSKGITKEEATELFLNNYTYYGCMMVKKWLCRWCCIGSYSFK